MSDFHPDTRGQRWSLVEPHLFSGAVGREEQCKQTSPACVGSARIVSATLGLPGSRRVCFPRLTLLRLQVALQGNCLKRSLRSKPLRFRFSGIHKGADSVGPAFCALPRSKQLRQPGAWRAHSPHVGGASYCLLCPSHSVSWVAAGVPVSAVPCVSSGELISGCDPPGRCQPSRIPRSLG